MEKTEVQKMIEALGNAHLEIFLESVPLEMLESTLKKRTAQKESEKTSEAVTHYIQSKNEKQTGTLSGKKL